MNILSDFEAHKRDEDFDREDAKYRSPYPLCGSCNHRHYGVCGICTCPKFVPVSHTQKVAFADAMMRPSYDEECEFCQGTGLVKSKPGPGGVITTVECDCGFREP